MKKQWVVALIVGLIVVGGGVGIAVYSSTQSNSEQNVLTAPVSSSEVTPPTTSTTTTSSAPGGYITQATFEADSEKYTNSKQVLFFHASWCPICQSIDKDATSNPSKIPENTVLIQTDFDNSTELRKKYSVTTQYTFVQIDSSGNLVKKWSATSLDKAVSQIQ